MARETDDQANFAASLPRIAPTEVRFIRLGRGGQFAETCFNEGVVALGFDQQPHALCVAGEWSALNASFRAAGDAGSAAANHTRQVKDFYTLAADALWVTSWRGKVWWAFAEPEVVWRDDRRQQLPRRRKVIGAWRSTDIQGEALFLNRLSTRLTQSFGYRGTTCDLPEAQYLIRRINGETEPLATEAELAQAAVTEVAKKLIAQLHWKDFEVLIDRIFADSGWRRVGILGETQADVDLVVEQTAARERAFVQVKSKATPAVLADYIGRFQDAGDFDRMFFICHSPSKALAEMTAPHPNIEVWFADTLAQRAVRSGQFDWLIERTR